MFRWDVRPEDVVISHGGQQASVAILQFLVSKRDVHAIAVDHLSYPGFRIWPLWQMPNILPVGFGGQPVGRVLCPPYGVGSTGDVMHHVIFFIFYSGISLVLMKVPEALAQRDPEFGHSRSVIAFGGLCCVVIGADSTYFEGFNLVFGC